MELVYLVILSLFLLYLTQIISKKFKLFDVPDGIKIHNEKIPNIAGLALIPYVLFMFYFFDYSQMISKTLNLFLIVIIIGLIDDLKNINPQTKILALLIPIYIFTRDVGEVETLGVYGSNELSLGSLSLVFSLLCIFLLTNAFNYIDGLDGLFALNVIVTLSTLFFLTGSEKNILIPFLIFLTIYFLFNINFLKIFPKQFFGNSGSLGFGFLVSSFLIIFTQVENFLHPSIIIWTVAFIVYEFLTINIIRIKLSKNIFERDLNFIFNLLKNKYSSIKSLIICTIIHLFFCSISIFIMLYETYFLSLLLFIIIFFIYLFFRLKQQSIGS